jgi:hypothetical protein
MARDKRGIAPFLNGINSGRRNCVWLLTQRDQQQNRCKMDRVNDRRFADPLVIIWLAGWLAG